MKAIVKRVYKDKNHTIDYTILRPAISHDDTDSYFHCVFYTPMMDIIMLSDTGLWKEKMTVFATPEIIEKFTGYNLFFQDWFFSFEKIQKCDFPEYPYFEIEFEWEEINYPFIKIRSDYYEEVLVDVCRMPKIISID